MRPLRGGTCQRAEGAASAREEEEERSVAGGKGKIKSGLRWMRRKLQEQKEDWRVGEEIGIRGVVHARVWKKGNLRVKIPGEVGDWQGRDRMGDWRGRRQRN